MARQLNSLGLHASGTSKLLAENREGEIILHLSDLDILLPPDVTDKLPDPFCTGAILHGMAGNDRVMVHFPADPAYRAATMVGLSIINLLANKIFDQPEDRSVYTLKVKGDWHSLRLAGAKSKIFSAHEAEIISRAPAAEAPACI
jgi:hypothetical protein